MGLVLDLPAHVLRGSAPWLVFCHAWAECYQVSALSVVSVISHDCDDAFWHFIKEFSFPITDSYASLCHKLSCVTAPRHMLDDKNNHFNHKQTRDLAH
jgi:hypothetical protein